MSNRVEATVEMLTFIDRPASACCISRAPLPSAVKVTMPHRSAPMSRTVTPGISPAQPATWKQEFRTRSQMAASPQSRA